MLARAALHSEEAPHVAFGLHPMLSPASGKYDITLVTSGQSLAHDGSHTQGAIEALTGLLRVGASS